MLIIQWVFQFITKCVDESINNLHFLNIELHLYKSKPNNICTIYEFPIYMGHEGGLYGKIKYDKFVNDFFLFIGFIDFIVDPSFQVMGDMLAKIIAPLQQRNSTISEESFNQSCEDKATSTTSLSSRPSTPGTPRSHSPGD